MIAAGLAIDGFAETANDEDKERSGGHGCKSEGDINLQHDNDSADQHESAGCHGDDGAIDEGLCGVGVVSDAVERVADFGFVVIGD